MHQHPISFDLSLIDLIVGAALLFSIVFFAAWLLSPALRAWIEQPKYRFLATVKRHDQSQESAHRSYDQEERERLS